MRRKIFKVLLIFAAFIAVFAVTEIIFASEYEMSVNVVDGKNVIGVNPTTSSLDFGDISRNNTIERYVIVKNDGKAPVYLAVLKRGELSNLVRSEKKIVSLSPGQEEKLSFSLKVPFSAQTKKYEGKVMIIHVPKIF